MAKTAVLSSSKLNTIFMATTLFTYFFKLQEYHGLPDVLNEIQWFFLKRECSENSR